MTRQTDTPDQASATPRDATAPDRQAVLARKNRRIAVTVLGGVMTMVGAAYAAVPLYELFCQVTGYGGTTQRADAPTGTIIDRTITVRFDGNVNSNLPWTFGPKERAITLRMGESRQTAYTAHNNGGDGNIGTSVFNVTPFEARLLQQARVLLLHRAAARGRRIRRDAGGLLHRPCDGRGPEHEAYQGDHPLLHVLPCKGT